jgi:hypothetical protein
MLRVPVKLLLDLEFIIRGHEIKLNRRFNYCGEVLSAEGGKTFVLRLETGGYSPGFPGDE